jgi:cytidine deaminase
MEGPELVFGLIAPIGVDLNLVTETLEQTLSEMSYSSSLIRLTTLMRDVPIGLPLTDGSMIESYQNRIAYANAVRAKLGDQAMAALAIGGIRRARAQAHEIRESHSEVVEENDIRDVIPPEELPLKQKAYIIRQLKRPEEVELLRRVYGKQFILISAYAPEDTRMRGIQERQRGSTGGLVDNVMVHNQAFALIAQDSKESTDKHGQNVRDAFPLGDIFIDATSRQACTDSLRRFINLFFGNNEITPSHDEYGMYLAKSASLRSSDLSRQVGCAIFHETGEVITLGCNEVPKAGGGTYWAGENLDSRDFVEGYDPNERRKREVLVDVIDRLKDGNFLSEEISSKSDSYEILSALLKVSGDRSISNSKLMDLIEFGRIVHAEMTAITDAARKGLSIQDATLYCTTFPCHICAKHIVASGIKKVIYLEPYAKSYAASLHSDSIEVDKVQKTKKVSFDAFIGLSPYRYRDMFEKGRRKYASGEAQRWNRGEAAPMIEVYFPAYIQSESFVMASLSSGLSNFQASE